MVTASTPESNALARMKMIATGLLICFAIIFIISKFFEKQYPFLSYLTAFAEASMIGGLADWFAVTALFQHPLGLPIPHTNLIEKRKDNIAKGLSNFIYKNFLTKEKLEKKFTELSKEIIAYIRKSENSLFFKEIIASYPDKIEFEDEKLKIFVAQQAHEYFKTVDLSKVGYTVVDSLVHRGNHQQLFDKILEESVDIVQNQENVKYVYSKIDKKAFFFNFGIKKYTEKLFEGVANLLNEVKENPDHQLRVKLDEKLQEFTQNIEQRKFDAQLEEIKSEIFSSQSYQDFINHLWFDIKDKTLDYIKNQNANNENFSQDISKFVAKQLESEYINHVFEKWIVNNITTLIEANEDNIKKYIENTIMSWSNTSVILEQYLGKDLQYIRINGSLVGGVIGLILHIVKELL
jgi:uncharacterized membrane-anchored protein YjiN (DUF445 family)